MSSRKENDRDQDELHRVMIGPITAQAIPPLAGPRTGITEPLFTHFSKLLSRRTRLPESRFFSSAAVSRGGGEQSAPGRRKLFFSFLFSRYSAVNVDLSHDMNNRESCVNLESFFNRTRQAEEEEEDEVGRKRRARATQGKREINGIDKA